MSNLCSLHLPPEIRQDWLIKEANFEIPDTAEGVKFSVWWGEALASEKRAVLRMAHGKDIHVMDAKKQLDSSIPDLG